LTTWLIIISIATANFIGTYYGKVEAKDWDECLDKAHVYVMTDVFKGYTLEERKKARTLTICEKLNDIQPDIGLYMQGWGKSSK